MSGVGVFTKPGKPATFFEDTDPIGELRSKAQAALIEFYDSEDHDRVLSELESELEMEFTTMKAGLQPMYGIRSNAENLMRSGYSSTVAKKSPTKGSGSADEPSSSAGGAEASPGAAATPAPTATTGEPLPTAPMPMSEAKADVLAQIRTALVDKVVVALQQIDTLKVPEVTVVPYTLAAKADAHQFAFFFKPEVTGPGVDFAAVMHAAVGILQAHGCTIGAVRVLEGSYLAENDLMSQHYGVINQVARRGLAALTASARARLSQLYSDLLDSGCYVLGAFEFLQRHPEFTPSSLAALNDSCGCAKLGGGTYACVVQFPEGPPAIVLNAFHPEQLVPFTTPGRVVGGLEGLADRKSVV
eukprot:RCo012001